MDYSPLIGIQDVSRVYLAANGTKTFALKDISLQIKNGEIISFIGSSGCGKTTLLRLIAGLDIPQKGNLFMENKKIERASSERGYIFQRPTLLPWKTVEQNAALGLKIKKTEKEKKGLIKKYIDMIGLSGFEKSYPHEISGGMAQRAAIIRSLIVEPKVLLLDEPLSALDAFKRIEMQNVLLDVWEKIKTTFVFVTHDIDEAIVLSDRIAVMTPRPGQIKKIIAVNLGKQKLRNRADNAFLNLRKEILEELKIAAASPEPEYAI
jgi:ABC-type nitrate/sulfonate/bicarbonate transport system ATPase subunit